MNNNPIDPVFWRDVDLSLGSDTGMPPVPTAILKKRMKGPGPGVRKFETCNRDTPAPLGILL